MKALSAIACISTLLLFAPANAADVKTPLACALGPASGTDQQVVITNSTAATLKTETIINIIVNAMQPGEADSCFAIDAPLGKGAKLTHATKLMPGMKGQKCSAFLSSDHPAIEHGPDNGMMTYCD